MRIFIALGIFALLFPALALAFPFGGQASQVIFCYNDAIWAQLGPPIGGPYIWTPATQTYQFGPPTHAGQWLLGLAGAPYYCLVSIEPIIVYAGTDITMMGSSGGAAPAYSPPASNTNSPTLGGTGTGGTGTGGTTGNGSTAIGHVVISEVFYNVDAAHGTDPLNQWIELYNGSSATVDLSGWTVQNSSTQTALPTGTTLASGNFLVIVATSSTESFWNIPSAAEVVSLGAPIDGGLSPNADALVLKNGNAGVVDAVSWGTNTSIFNPAVAVSLSGYSLSRKTLSQDTNTAGDWAASSIPTPGK
jgi:hypothetical protein